MKQSIAQSFLDSLARLNEIEREQEEALKNWLEELRRNVERIESNFKEESLK